MATFGEVNITVVDNGSSAVVVAGQRVQVVIGPCTGGTANTVVGATRPSTLATNCGYGPAVEAGALSCINGGTVLLMKAATTTPGAVVGGSTAKTITGATVANPSVITAVAHGFVTGDLVTIAGVGGTTTVNGVWPVTVLTSSTFSVPVAGVGAYTSGGTATWAGFLFFGTGTSSITATFDATNGAFDEYYVKVRVITGGTIGVTGIVIQISLDAGRNYGPIIALGTANTYAIPNTGMTLAFGAGTLVALDYATFATTPPKASIASVQACLTALAASPYAIVGWSSLHIVGVYTGAEVATLQTSIQTLATTNAIFTRAFISIRDATPPTVWGGAGETEAAWMTAILADTISTDAKRLTVGAGCRNMPSAFPNASAGAWRPRRNSVWAAAARQVEVPPQRHLGKVLDGSLTQIVIDSTYDPLDGFVYHDERITPGLDYLTAGTGGRFLTTRTRIGLPGVYVAQPLTMATYGSDFSLMMYGNVMDIACTIVHTVGQKQINSDVKLNANGTIYENEASSIENTIKGALDAAMTSQGMVSYVTVTVDRTTNVSVQKKVVILVTIGGRGYILSEDVTIQFANSLAAA